MEKTSHPSLRIPSPRPFVVSQEGYMSTEQFEIYMDNWKRGVQYIFLSIAIMNMTKVGLEIFLFRRPDNYYTNGDKGVENNTSNYWKLANQIFLNGAFYIFALATVTQILSLLGIAPALNLYMWEFGVMSGVGLLNTVYGALTFKHYLEAWEVRNNDDDKFTAT